MTAYEVGYRKPPEATQFRKGQSGNPKGRPRGSQNKPLLTFGDERLKALFLTEAYRPIPIQDGGKSITMPMAQAVIRSVAVAAAKGQAKAQRLFLEMIQAIEEEHYQSLLGYTRALIDYKHEWEEVIHEAQAQGRAEPDPVPHPKDIEVNFRTGHVTLTGPLTRGEQKKWNDLRRKKQDIQDAIRHCKADLAKPKCRYKKQIQEELDHNQKMLDMISRAIRD